MNQERIVLTAKDILEKRFKVDTRGYRPQEVDKFLDLIIRDYEEFLTLLRESENEKREFVEENIKLKHEIRTLKTKLDVLKDGSNDVSNSDMLRRLSNLEKIIYGNE